MIRITCNFIYFLKDILISVYCKYISFSVSNFSLFVIYHIWFLTDNDIINMLLTYFKTLILAYFLEDCVQMVKFVPPPDNRKNKNKDKDEENLGAGEDDENMNLKVSPEYGEAVRQSLSKMNEKDISFELIEVCIDFILFKKKKNTLNFLVTSLAFTW